MESVAATMNARPGLTNKGVIVSVRGSVVDVRFDEKLPSIYSVLRAGAKQEIVIEVVAQRDAQHVRGIALTPTQGLARGMAVEDKNEEFDQQRAALLTKATDEAKAEC